MDAKRLRDKIGMVSVQNYDTIRKAVVHLAMYDRSPSLSGPAESGTEAEAV